MIQFNLLPTIKLDYIKAQRTRRLVFAVSGLVSIAALALLICLLVYSGLQKKHLSDLNKDISSQSAELKSKPQISKILTVQNQLESLTALHAGKPAAANLFTYLNEITPSQVSISSFQIDFTTQTATIAGSSDSLSSVNKFIDTLKYTTYTIDSSNTKTPAFTNIVLSSFGLGADTKNASQAASYSVTLTYDKTIFDITQKTTLSVPNQTSSHSAATNASTLFQATGTTPTQGSN